MASLQFKKKLTVRVLDKITRLLP